MRKVPFVIGILMMLLGGYLCWWWWDALMWGDAWIDNLFWWITALTGGVLLISFGPGVIAFAYVTTPESSYKRIAKQREWQVIQVPLRCTECQNEISIRSLEWIGDDDVRCPFCSKDLEIRTSRSYM
jgi:DNA-directed RNA polymerase subunit RPC12/RpoP